MYRFQTSLDIFRLLTFLNAVASHLFWGSSVGYSSIRWWAGAARHPGTGGKGKNHVPVSGVQRLGVNSCKALPGWQFCSIFHLFLGMLWYMKVFRPHTVASQALMLPPFQRRLNPWQWCGSQFIWVIFFGKLCNFLEVCCLWPAECPALQCPVLWPGPRLLPMLPSWAQPKALEIFRFAHYAFKLGGAMGIGCVSDVFSRRYTCQNRTSGKILSGELMHSKDSLLLWYGKVLVFALLEFCFLVSCAGFNLDSIEGEKLPNFAKTLKTGAIRDPRWCLLMTANSYVAVLRRWHHFGIFQVTGEVAGLKSSPTWADVTLRALRFWQMGAIHSKSAPWFCMDLGSMSVMSVMFM